MYKNIVGIDEAGRGSLCGPVIAAALLLDSKLYYHSSVIKDSKQLKPHQRSYLFQEISSKHIFSIGSASVNEINELNILNATMLAMKRAIINLKLKSEESIFLIDGNKSPSTQFKCINIIKGDTINLCISSASIIAKVYRDTIMHELSSKTEYKKYMWEENKGYGTNKHIEAIKQFGITKLHRKKFCSKYL